MSILALIRAAGAFAAGALAAGVRSTRDLLASLPRRNLDRVWYWLSPTPGWVPFVVLRQSLPRGQHRQAGRADSAASTGEASPRSPNED